MSYTPGAGDVIWLDFTPRAGQETAVVLTPQAYSVATGLALVVPVTTKARGGTFEVALRGAHKVKGVALANELRTIDYAARNADKFDICPADALDRIREIGEALMARLQ